MKITIRKGEKKDIPQVLELVKELAVYERAPNEVITTVGQMERDGFGENSFYRFLVAEREEKIIGMALYYTAYSTWKGKYIYLDDLIVTEKQRRSGTGKLLFDALLKEAKREGANQLRWHVLEWNTPAINFYKKYNAGLDPEWIMGKLSKEQINSFE
ncbi:MAG TPA: GNAT family N-acetyltransferase [Bacteroidia bacterium]|nr:GNAT family N-acetyltransferase [Bacteroidia bacterium]